jgi:O-antigen ligase
MNPVRKQIHGKIFLYGCMALAFLLPFPQDIVVPVSAMGQPVHLKFVAGFILILFLNWLAGGRFKAVPQIFRDRSRLGLFSFAGLYLIYLAGMIGTSNTGFGLFDLEVKLSLLIFPLVFATADKDDVNPKMVSWIFFAFIAGCFISSLILFFIAFQDYIRAGDPIVFFYTHFSRFVHTSYFAMYLNMAITFLGYRLVAGSAGMKTGIRILYAGLLLFFSLEVFLLSSKAGIFCLLLILFLVCLYFMMQSGKVRTGLILMLVAGGTFYAAFRFLPVTAYRFKVTEKVISGKGGTDNDIVEGNHERLVVWKAALHVIREHPLLGVGTGDVRDEMMMEFEREHKHAAYTMQLNAHNQFMQTYVATGLAGFLTLLLMLVIPGWQAFRRRNLLYFLFLLVFALNILVESMLEVQAGVVYYAFFNTLLFCYMKSGVFKTDSPDKA